MTPTAARAFSDSDEHTIWDRSLAILVAWLPKIQSDYQAYRELLRAYRELLRETAAGQAPPAPEFSFGVRFMWGQIMAGWRD